MKVIWGGPIVGTPLAGGFGDGIAGGVNAGIEGGAEVGIEGEVPQPSNTIIRDSARASILKKSLKDFIYIRDFPYRLVVS